MSDERRARRLLRSLARQYVREKRLAIGMSEKDAVEAILRLIDRGYLVVEISDATADGFYFRVVAIDPEGAP